VAISVTGFTGTVNQAQWSENSAMAGQRYATADYPANGNGGTAGLAVTAAAGSRAVNVATGKGIGHGVTVRSDAIVNLALATPAAGRWYKIVVHRDWTTGTASIIALPWDTTTSTVPTVAGIPTTTAVGEVHQPGTGADDQPLAAAWVNAANTTVTVFDLRTFTIAEQNFGPRITLLEQTNTADLDSLVLIPATSEGRRMHVDELNADFVAVDGVWTQLGVARFATASARDTAYAKAAAAYRITGVQCVLATAPLVAMEHNGNQASPAAGWQRVGLVKPSAAVFSGGTGAATINDDGSVTVVTSTSSSNLLVLRDCFAPLATYGTDEFEVYVTWAGSGSPFYMRLAAAGTPDTSANYDYYGTANNQAGTPSNAVSAGASWPISDGVVATEFEGRMQFRHANESARRTRGFMRSLAGVAPVGTSERIIQTSLNHRLGTQFDGLAIGGFAVGTLIVKVSRA